MEDYLVNMRQISDAIYYNVVKENDFHDAREEIQKGMNLLYEANRDKLRTIAIYNRDGSLMAAEPVATQKEDPDVTRQEWYQSAVEEMENIHFSTPHIQNLFEDSTFRYYWVISSSRVVELTENRDSRLGVLLVDMDFSSISRMMNQINKVGNGQYYYLCNSDGEIIYHPRQIQISDGICRENSGKAASYKDGVYDEKMCIRDSGDIGHNDSIARTRGVRKALGTGVEKDGNINSEPVGTNVDGKATAVQDGTLEAGGKKFTVRELGSQEMKNSAGATWDAATAGNAIGTWSSSFGKDIDVVVSNNDGMGMSMFNAWSKDNKVPTFGYDANSDAVAAIAEGYGGTISQHADVQAYLTLRVLRNALDGVDIDTGIGTADEAGNVLSENEYRYSEEERSYYALNLSLIHI